MKQLFEKLSEAYSDANLNLVSGKLIGLYKQKQFGAIREISNRVSDFVDFEDIENISKCFSKLLMLYHPDKGQYHRNKIECFYEAGNNEMLGQFSHILVAIELSDKIEIKEKELEIDFEPEYVWDDNVEGNGYHTIFEEGELIFEEGFENCEDYEKTFYNAVKIRMYGNIDMNFPFYYLEDFDEVEMSDSGIEFLDGIKHCKHARNINLNGNSISDITDLLGLKRIEELYLADNQISYIDILSRLYNLKKLDISNNNIDDISPLNELPNLQYLNVIGNHIPNQQIEKLKDLGVIVVC